MRGDFPTFSSRSFIVSGLMLNSDSFQANFCEWCKVKAQFHVLYLLIQLSQHHLLKGMSCPHWVFLALLLNIS